MVKKIVASIAVVGTIAAVALFNVANNSDAPSGTFLAADNTDADVQAQFNDFISKH